MRLLVDILAVIGAVSISISLFVAWWAFTFVRQEQ